jgi:hypothetical protein
MLAILAVAIDLATPAAPLAGLYEAHQMEIGAALELRKDGHFRYQLDYGAVSEEAEGDWTFAGQALRLTTRPAPKPPSYELVRDDPAPVGQVVLKLVPPGFGTNYRIDAIATDPSGRQGMVTTNGQGVVEAGQHKLSSIDPLIPVYQTVGGHFPLDPRRGHRLLLRFHANDLGRAAFNRQPLAVSGDTLTLERYGEQIRFIRSTP